MWFFTKTPLFSVILITIIDALGFIPTFRKSYIKKSTFKSITYRNGFGHGTCEIILHDQKMTEYVLMGLKYIREMYNKSIMVSYNLYF